MTALPVILATIEQLAALAGDVHAGRVADDAAVKSALAAIHAEAMNAANAITSGTDHQVAIDAFHAALDARFGRS